MWGETLFNIEEDDYNDYEMRNEINNDQINHVQPSEVMF